MSDEIGGAYKNDTAQGTEFAGGYGGRASAGIIAKDKPLEFKKTLLKLLGSFAPFKYMMIAAAVFSAISTVFVVLGPKMMANITNQIFKGIEELLSKGTFDKDPIFKGLTLLFVLYFISAVFLYAQGYIMSTVSQRVSMELRSQINKKLSGLPVSYFDKHSHGDVMSRITNDVDTVGNTLNQGLTQIVTSICTIIGIAIMMFTMNAVLTLIVLAVVPLSYAVMAIIAKRSQRFFRDQQNYLGAANGYIEEMYGGHSVIKAYGMEKRCVQKFDTVNEGLYDSGWRSQALSGFITPLIVFIGNLGYVAVVVFGAYLSVVSASFDIGMMYAFVQYVRSFTSPINQTAQISNIVQSTLAAAERIFVFLESPEEQKNHDELPMPLKVEGNIKFDSVSFGYEDDTPVLRDFSLDVPAGSRVAIVGRTGSGKTTVVKLLMRFYDIKHGKILLDGTDITSYNKREYRHSVAMVLQDTWLFNGTISDNIRYGDLNATNEEVTEAAIAAGAHSFITRLKDGYDTVLGEEISNLSEGEKQLLSIARAVIRKSSILIFDEATSSIDTLTERVVQDTINRITKGKTCFVVAHRLSTIINSDIIVVLENGSFVESGTHDELLNKKGLYAEMYNTQFAR